MTNYKPAIVVVAYNRVNSLARLLNSLAKAKYVNNDIELIISIDNGDNIEVLKIAENFIWKFGNKKVHYQDTNLGLKKHILQCGDLTKKYGSIILLEDDLYVSPYFYSYTQKALNFYDTNNNISQISLYKHPINNVTRLAFIPLEENSDIFFMQFASSWGQAWSYKQWEGFKNWFNKNDNSVSFDDNIPDFVIKWKETSWLKYFIKYNQVNEKFTVYPKVSLTSNFSDTGTNVTMSVYQFQQPILMEEKNYIFKKQEESIAIYDTYFELHKDVVRTFLDDFSDLEFDLYGTKNLNKISSKYLISIKKCSNPIKTYALSLKPHELNVIEDLEGNYLSLALTENFTSCLKDDVKMIQFKYYWTHSVEVYSLWILFKHRSIQKYINILNKLKRKFK